MEEEHIEVTCSQGRLRGLVKKSSGLTETTYFSFQGIPYAKPPVGPLRFKAPEAYGSWEGTRDATKVGNDSLQKHMLLDFHTGNEDCLYLNVYTPKLDLKAKKAVMVWIHGGGFSKGSGSTELYGPDYLIEHDIVLVSINYRLGALGFLSLENENVPGNNGLKDQTLALRWVKDNIASFGGDFNNVTIFGESAGAASVHYHILSPCSSGLFHKAILQSGTAVCPWALQPHPRKKALMLARELGCTSQDLEEVLKFLQSASAMDIVIAQEKESFCTEQEIIQMFGLHFVPCVELVGEEPFLSERPHKLLQTGKYNKVPVINGTVDKEGMLALTLKLLHVEVLNEDPSLLVPTDLEIVPGSAEARDLGKEILQFYTNSDKISWDVMHEFVDFMSDLGFANGSHVTRQSMLNHAGPVYTYMFTHKSPRALSSFYIPPALTDKAAEFLASGACHGDELVHQFKPNMPQMPIPPPLQQDQAFMNKFLKAWTTFAKTGNPNCKELGSAWLADDLKNPHYLELGPEPKTVNNIICSKRKSFWNEVYGKYS